MGRILKNGFAESISNLTRFYILFRWNFGEASVKFDEARRIAIGCGINLEKEWGLPGFISKNKEFIKVLGPQERKIGENEDSPELIDILHSVLRVWEKNKREDMIRILQKSGYGEDETFYKIAQAISETLPMKSKEKMLLDGFLSGKEKLIKESRKTMKPLDEYLGK